MTGLVLKNLWAGGITPLTVLIFLMLCAVAGVLVRSQDLFTISVMALCGGFVGSYIFQFYSKCNTAWQRLEAVMPIRPEHVELSKYTAHIIAFAPSLAGIGIYSTTSYFSGVWRNADEVAFANEVIWAYGIWSGMFLIFGAIYFILMQLVSSQGMVLVAQIGGFILAMAAIIGAQILLRVGFEDMSVAWTLLMIPVALVIFSGSYFLNLYIYKRKYVKKECRA